MTILPAGLKRQTYRNGKKTEVLTATLLSTGITQKPDGRSGISSDTATSTGANTSCAHAPIAPSSMPVQSYFSSPTNFVSLMQRQPTLKQDCT